jgi:hypothetical protein
MFPSTDGKIISVKKIPVKQLNPSPKKPVVAKRKSRYTVELQIADWSIGKTISGHIKKVVKIISTHHPESK